MGTQPQYLEIGHPKLADHLDGLDIIAPHEQFGEVGEADAPNIHQYATPAIILYTPSQHTPIERSRQSPLFHILAYL